MSRLLLLGAGGGGGISAVVSDSFNRADAASLGSADTGQAWTAHVGTWGITSNRASNQSAAPSIETASVNAGIADGEVEVTLAVLGGVPGVVARLTDGSNFLVFLSTGTEVRLWKVVAGAFTLLGSFTVAVAAGDVLKVRLSGSDVRAYHNGVERIAVTETHNQAATRHGLYADASNVARWEDFTVRAL